jgi:hypothetical protein
MERSRHERVPVAAHRRTNKNKQKQEHPASPLRTKIKDQCRPPPPRRGRPPPRRGQTHGLERSRHKSRRAATHTKIQKQVLPRLSRGIKLTSRWRRTEIGRGVPPPPRARTVRARVAPPQATVVDGGRDKSDASAEVARAANPRTPSRARALPLASDGDRARGHAPPRARTVRARVAPPQATVIDGGQDQTGASRPCDASAEAAGAERQCRRGRDRTTASDFLTCNRF